MNQNKAKQWLLSLAKYLLLSIAAFISIFPFYWMVAGATNTSNAIAQGNLMPGNFLFTNLKNLFATYDIPRIMFNSFKIAVVSVGVNLTITSMAAFGFEKFKTKWSERIYSIFLISMMIPFSALMIPLFKMMAGLHLVNTHLAVIMPTMASTFLIFFFRQNFKSFPNDILEAARIDGATNIYAFFRIVMPSMKATYAAAAIYSFMTAWNNYLWPLIVLQTDATKTMTLMISSLSTSSYVADYGMQMMALVIATIPMMILFLVMQRSFVEGMTGSVKG